MASSPKDKAMKRVRGLMAKVLLEPASEESRTCAVIALKTIAEHGLLTTTPGSVTLDLALVSDAELISLHEALMRENTRRSAARSEPICVQCGRPCTVTDAYSYFPNGYMHIGCVMDNVRSSMARERGGRW